MTRLWLRRGFGPLLALAGLVAVAAAYAQEPRKGNSVVRQDETSALEITDKQYDEETGELLLVLRNRSDVTVTAFAVSVVSADSTGRGPTRVQGEDQFLGDGIAPGTSFEMRVLLGFPGQAPSALSGRAVSLDHEIRSDNTSYGNTAAIDRLFESRAAYFVAVREALTRLQAAQKRLGLQRSVLPLLQEETERGREARSAITDEYQARQEELDRPHLAAVASVGDLAEQTVERIEAGHPAEQAIADLETILEAQLDRASRNIRQEDLERAEK